MTTRNTHMKRIAHILSLFTFVFALGSYAQSADFSVKAEGTQTFRFADKAGRNQVLFYSKAPIEDIVGSASGLTGSITLDPKNVASTITGEFTIDVKTMTTGISKRDEHMQGEMWLNAATYPTIQFKLKQLKDVKKVNNTKIEANALGEMTLHGVTLPMTVPVTLIYMEESEKTKARLPGDLLQLRTKFSVKLADFGIKGFGDLIGSKIAEAIDIEMGIVGTNAVK